LKKTSCPQYILGVYPTKEEGHWSVSFQTSSGSFLQHLKYCEELHVCDSQPLLPMLGESAKLSSAERGLANDHG
jgi:hypothetical protein